MPCVDRGLAFEQYTKILNLPEVWGKKKYMGVRGGNEESNLSLD